MIAVNALKYDAFVMSNDNDFFGYRPRLKKLISDYEIKNEELFLIDKV